MFKHKRRNIIQEKNKYKLSQIYCIVIVSRIPSMTSISLEHLTITPPEMAKLKSLIAQCMISGHSAYQALSMTVNLLFCRLESYSVAFILIAV